VAQFTEVAGPVFAATELAAMSHSVSVAVHVEYTIVAAMPLLYDHAPDVTHSGRCATLLSSVAS